MTASRASERTLREFGWVVGGIFLAVGGWWLWREKWLLAARILAGLGGMLVVLGALSPHLLRQPHRAWMGLAHVLGSVVNPLLLALVYGVVMTPIAVVMRLTGHDPLGRRQGRKTSYWVPYSGRAADPKHFDKMY